MQDKKNQEEIEDVDKEQEDDVVFEELNADGEVMSDKQKAKNDKDKLKDKFEDKIERLTKERDEYLNGWKRIQADYKNREREIEEYKKGIIKFANSNLIRDILPIIDGYDIAKSHTEKWEAVDKDWRLGIEYLFSQLLKVLENNGIVIFGEVGDVYDPNLHEAVDVINLTVEEKDKSDKIVNVLQKGYKLGDKLLRPARVKVGHFDE